MNNGFCDVCKCELDLLPMGGTAGLSHVPGYKVQLTHPTDSYLSGVYHICNSCLLKALGVPPNKPVAKKLRSLEEAEEQAMSFYKHNGMGGMYLAPQPNGIACPKCGAELVDSNPSVMLTSYPPKKNTACSNPECDYIGYRTS